MSNIDATIEQAVQHYLERRDPDRYDLMTFGALFDECYAKLNPTLAGHSDEDALYEIRKIGKIMSKMIRMNEAEKFSGPRGIRLVEIRFFRENGRDTKILENNYFGW